MSLLETYERVCREELQISEELIKKGADFFSLICKSLNFSFATFKPNNKNSVVVSKQLQLTLKTWIVVTIFVVLYNEQTTATDQSLVVDQKTSPVRLVNMLMKVESSLQDFFTLFTELFNRLLLEPDLLAVATQLKEDFTVSSILYGKYVQLWSVYGPKANCIEKQRWEDLVYFGWILFVCARKRLSVHYYGLANIYILLLSCFHIVISNIDGQSLEVEVATALKSLGSPDSSKAGADNLTFIEKLCLKPKVKVEDAGIALLNLKKLFLSLIHEQVLTEINLSIFDEAVLSSNVSKISSYYDSTYLSSNDITVFDPRVFLDAQSLNTLYQRCISNEMEGNCKVEEPQVSKQEKFSDLDSVALKACHFQKGNSRPQSGNHPSTPPNRVASRITCHEEINQTPVTAAVETNNWMSIIVTSYPDNPSKNLESFFSSGNVSVLGVEKLVNSLSSKVIRRKNPIKIALSMVSSPNSTIEENGNDFEHADSQLLKVRSLGIKLFFHTLEKILLSEEKRLGKRKCVNLLTNEIFHCSLFACCIEVMLKGNSLLTLSFPKILDLIGVNAFDFGKVIESFVKHIPNLPVQLKRHMSNIEQQILECYAWKSTSNFFPLLENDGHKKQQSTLSVLQLFFRKIFSLAALRIDCLCKMLHLAPFYINQIWTATKECIISHHIVLLKNRHLDQIILCTIYGVSKVNRIHPEITFKLIIDVYKRMDINGQLEKNAKYSTVIRNIVLSDETETGDVIKFYNKIYIPVMKSFLLQFQHQESQERAAVSVATNKCAIIEDEIDTKVMQREHVLSDNQVVIQAATAAAKTAMKIFKHSTDVSSLSHDNFHLDNNDHDFKAKEAKNLVIPSGIQNIPRMVQHTSPKRVLKSNIYVSPHRQLSERKKFMTPRTKALYAFGESPSRDLAIINRALNPKKRVAISLPFEGCGGQDNKHAKHDLD